jgi:hypothetical protein
MQNKLLAVALVLVGSAALAQAPAPETQADQMAAIKGVEVGLRLGYAIPMGSAVSGTSLSDTTSGQIPLQLDAGYRFDQNWFAGAYVGFGIVLPKNCPAGDSCSGNDLRFGVEGQYHLSQLGLSFDPWLGLGVGYEIGHASDNSGSSNLKGLEFANLSLGANFRMSPNFGLGPVLGLTLGQYSTISSGDASVDVGDAKAMHMWLQLGVRGVFDLM